MSPKKKRTKKKTSPAPAKQTTTQPAPKESSNGWFGAWCNKYGLAVAIAFGVFFRPFVDGIVYPLYNAHFAWWFAVVFVIWAGRALLRGANMRGGVPMALYGVMAIVGFASLWYGIRPDLTYHAIPPMLTAGIMLILGMNALTNDAARKVVVSTLLALALVEGLYGLYHVIYVLPQARAAVNENPALIEVYFPGSVLTPEMRHRLESNRAFGTFLFPNAYSAFLIMLLPIAVAAAIRKFIKPQYTEPNDTILSQRVREWPGSAKIAAMAVTGLAFVVILVVSVYFMEVARQSDFEGNTILQSDVFRYGGSLIIAALATVGPAILAARNGLAKTGSMLSSVLLPVIAVFSIIGVYISGTRGAWIGLVMAIAWFLIIASLRRVGLKRVGTVAAATVILVSAVLAFMPTEAAAQNPQGLEVAGSGESPVRMDSATFVFRIHYWRIGLLVMRDHLSQGVGLGAYQGAFERYQYKGAPFANMVHNDYIQTICELGIVGGGGFVLFWAYFIIRGFAALLREKDAGRFIYLGGFYTGAIAFAAHQAVDFGFQNPSLTLPLYLVCGLFLGQIGLPQLPARVTRISFIAFLVVAAVTAGGASRVYVADKQLQTLGNRTLRLNAAYYLIIDAQQPRSEFRAPSANAMTSFISNSNQLQAMGFFGVPAGPNQFRKLPMGPEMPPNAKFFAEDKVRAIAIGKQGVEKWLPLHMEVDASFPYRPDLAHDIYLYHELLFRTASTAVEQQRLGDTAVRWAKTYMERDPYSGWARMTYGKSMWIRAGIEPPSRQIEAYEEALEQYEAAVRYMPSQPEVYRQFIERLDELTDRFGSKYPERAKEWRAKVGWAGPEMWEAQQTSPYSLTGETHETVLRKWSESESSR